jgi:hypothetical protein
MKEIRSSAQPLESESSERLFGAVLQIHSLKRPDFRPQCGLIAMARGKRIEANRWIVRETEGAMRAGSLNSRVFQLRQKSES